MQRRPAQRPTGPAALLPVRSWLEQAVERGVRRAVADGLTRQLEDRLRQYEQAAVRRQSELLDEVRGELHAWERRTRRDVWTALEQEAARSSAELVRTAMGRPALSTHPHDTLRAALQAAPADGLAVEVGGGGGTTLPIIAEHRPDGRVHGVAAGRLEDALAPLLDAGAEPVSFLHVQLDGDFHRTTARVLELVGPRLVEGSVVVFGEYYNFPTWQQHEHRAWTEHVERTGLAFEYAGLTMDDEQVWVRVTGAPAR